MTTAINQPSLQEIADILNPQNYPPEYRKDIARIKDILATPVRERLGTSQEFMDQTYRFAFNLYTAGDFENAEGFFRALTLLDHLNPDYWKGLGATLQMQGRPAEAIRAYMACMIQLREDPDLFLQITECAIAVEDWKTASNSVKHLVKITKDNPKHSRLYQKAEVLVAALKKKNDPEKN